MPWLHVDALPACNTRLPSFTMELTILLDTVRCFYNSVQYDMMLHIISLQWLRHQVIYHLYYTFNTNAAAHLAMHGARTSAAMVLTLFPEYSRFITITVFKTNGCPVAPGDQKLSWASLIWPWASKNYNRLYKDGNFRSISGRLRQNISLKHCNNGSDLLDACLVHLQFVCQGVHNVSPTLKLFLIERHTAGRLQFVAICESTAKQKATHTNTQNGCHIVDIPHLEMH